MSHLLDFLSGNRADSHGRMFADILLFDDEKLENDHRYIQWIFPLETMSENVWESPVLSKEEKGLIKHSPEMQENMLRALERMSAFYASSTRWLQESDHNHLRVTRILHATRSLLGQTHADHFYRLLMERIAEAGAQIDPESLDYWKRAVGRALKRSTKIYLDIDGTMIHEDLTENYGKPTKVLEEFIIALRPFDTFWLTTHCMDGDPTNAQEKLKSVLPMSLFEDIDRISPTAWQSLKTEAIDFNSDFIWFDNDIFPDEWKALERCTPDQMAIQVDLRANDTQLKEITRDLLSSS